MNFFILAKQELLLAGIIFLLLFIKVGAGHTSNRFLLPFINALLLVNFLAGFAGAQSGVLFNEMFRTTSLIITEKHILNLATLLVSLIAYNWLLVHEHLIEFYLLMLSTLLGMFFMLSAGNLLMLYLGLELSGIPLAAMANFDLHKKQSAEAAMKFIVSSAFSSGLLLLGISFLYGTTGTLVFSELPAALTGSALQLFAMVLILAGFAFKISVVPFHLWTADVYQGAPVAVTAYLSVVSKGAAIFVFVSLLYTVFNPLALAWYKIIFLLSILTMVVGNLFAIRQTNIKRLLAFSSIVQAGFLLVGISGHTQAAMASVVYFILVYVFSNLAAFGVIGLISALTGKEDIADYRGLAKSNPILAWIMAIALFSLAGVPPAAGFFGKFFLLLGSAAQANYVLVVIAGMNMIVSLYYYLHVVRTMFADRPETGPLEKLAIPVLPRIALYACAAGILVVALAGGLYDYIFKLSFA